MAKKAKTDQLSVVGLVSAILRHTAQQRSLGKSRQKREAKLEDRRHPERAAERKRQEKAEKKEAKRAKPKDTRSADDIRADVDSARSKLVDTVDAVKYDLDVPARLGDVRDRAAAAVPRSWRGETQARLVAGAVLVAGWGTVAWSAIARSRR